MFFSTQYLHAATTIAKYRDHLHDRKFDVYSPFASFRYAILQTEISETNRCISELDMDWIHPWIGVGWVGSGFSENLKDWSGLGGTTVTLHTVSFKV